MKQLTSTDKKKLLSRAFWDKNIDENQLVELMNGKINAIPLFDKKIIYSRLLSTFDWYTLLKLIPEKLLKDVLADDVLKRLYPKELKEKYTYARSIFINKNDLMLKIDFINDVPFHFGNFEQFDFFGKVDNWKNILSNKLCALSRMEPKDYADILFISQKYNFNWEEIIQEAKKKHLWVEPVKISKMIGEFPVKLLKPIKWITPPELKQATYFFSIISKDILKGLNNSIVPDN